MKSLSFAFVALASFGLLNVAPAPAQSPATLGQIERLDPALDALLPADAKIEILASGFTWTEGPVWVEKDGGGHLLFSDIPRNTIFRWDPDAGISTFLQPSGYTGASFYGKEPGSNGLALDAEGRLLACNMATVASRF
jgi:gluconolactonase